MPARETDANYYIRRLETRLPDSEGQPLITPLVNDFTVVSDYHYFNDVAERVKVAYEVDVDVPTLPGLEPDPISPEELERKKHNAVAAARSREGAGAVMQVIVSTFNEDTSRALYRLQRRGDFIPVIETDTPDSLYARVGDYVEDLFTASALARVVPSSVTRKSGEADLRSSFLQKKPEVVLPLASLTGRNNARLRGVWLNQLERTTQGFRYMPLDAKRELEQYVASRPEEFMMRPDMHKILASIHRKNTGKFRRTA
jgi:hypothetical protein